MLSRKHGLSLAGLTLGCALAGALPAAAGSRSTDVPYTTPPGITLVDVTADDPYSVGRFLWRRLGDAHGAPLYTRNADGASGRSTCYDACAKEFPAVLAPEGAAAFGEWTIVARADGTRQWAYRGQPIYSFAGDPSLLKKRVIDSGDFGAFESRKDDGLDPGSRLFVPEAGWHQAVFDPKVQTPSGIRLQSLQTANGYGFVVAASGMPIYVLEADPKAAADWKPVYAAEIALPLGDFTVTTRADGTKQWAYRGQRLYTYQGDYSSSDINGLQAEPAARIALAYRHFMPAGLTIRAIETRGPLMVTSQGFTVYTQSRQHLQYGGRETRGGYHYAYTEAKALGVRGCLAECIKTWLPVLAPAKAQPRGFWEISVRPDGRRQWTYKGSPIYTYRGDQAPGDIAGNNQHVVLFGDPQGRTDLSVTGGDTIDPENYYAAFGSGLYWHLADIFD